MQPQQKFSGSGPGAGEQSGAISCSQCGSPMPPEMRFCRACGNRLGEGPAEYTETVRLPNGATSPNAQFNTQYSPGMGGPMVQPNFGDCPRRRRLGFRGTTWIWIVLVAFFAMGGLMSTFRRANRGARPAFTINTNRSYLGVNGLRTAEGGVTFDAASPPDGPADKAGLVGGDIITSFDGHPVTRESEVMDVLRQTPVGKKVEVIFTRDGNFHNTQMTTISNDEMDRLKEAFDDLKPKGYFGFEVNRTTRVNNGVRIDWVEPNRPADLFGIKEGDIITDFDSHPIRTSDELYLRVRRAIPKTIVEVVVLRDGQTLKIPVTMGRDR